MQFGEVVKVFAEQVDGLQFAGVLRVKFGTQPDGTQAGVGIPIKAGVGGVAAAVSFRLRKEKLCPVGEVGDGLVGDLVIRPDQHDRATAEEHGERVHRSGWAMHGLVWWHMRGCLFSSDAFYFSPNALKKLGGHFFLSGCLPNRSRTPGWIVWQVAFASAS